MSFLRRKGEILCKVYKHLNNYPELVQSLMSLVQSEGKEGSCSQYEFAMFMFEQLAEFHLPQNLIIENSASFMNIF